MRTDFFNKIGEKREVASPAHPASLEVPLADILIRKVDETTKELLRLRAERRGKGL